MSETISLSERAKWPSSPAARISIVLVVWLAALGALASRYVESYEQPGVDFYQFWVAGDMVRSHASAGRHGLLDLYSPAAFQEIGRNYASKAVFRSPRQARASRTRTQLDNASTPFFYFVFSLITFGHYDRDFAIYIVLSICCLAGAIVMLARRLGYSLAATGVAIALAASSSPVISDSRVVNVNCPQLAIGCIYLLMRDRARARGRINNRWLFAAGVLMGIFLAFKPNLLLVPVLLLLRGIFRWQWRPLLAEGLGTLAALAAAIGISSWSFGGAKCWLAWIGVMRRLGSDPAMPSEYGNFSLARAILESTGRNFLAELTVAGLVLAAGAIWLGSRTTPSGPSPGDRETEFRHDATIFALGGIVAFLTAGLAWVHYPILIFPLFLVAAARMKAGGLGWCGQIARSALLATIIALLLYPPPKEISRLIAIGFPFTLATWNHCDQAALILALGLALWMEISWFGNWRSIE